jgi:hypothetical protein
VVPTQGWHSGWLTQWPHTSQGAKPRALAGQLALVGNLPVGIFPRDVTLAGDTLVVANYGSDSLSLIDATTLALPK